MGEIHKPDVTLSVDIIVELDRMVRRDISNHQRKEERFDVIIVTAHVVISCVLSMRSR